MVRSAAIAAGRSRLRNGRVRPEAAVRSGCRKRSLGGGIGPLKSVVSLRSVDYVPPGLRRRVCRASGKEGMRRVTCTFRLHDGNALLELLIGQIQSELTAQHV